jgi:anti-anti-sigma regulatory factor
MSDTRILQPEQTHVSLNLGGEFDAYDLESLREALDRLLGSKETVCVDLSRVTFMDLRCARELATHSHLCGGRLILRNPHGRQYRASELAAMETYAPDPSSSDQGSDRTPSRIPSVLTSLTLPILLLVFLQTVVLVGSSTPSGCARLTPSPIAQPPWCW